jgi:hypothetical protein
MDSLIFRPGNQSMLFTLLLYRVHLSVHVYKVQEYYTLFLNKRFVLCGLHREFVLQNHPFKPKFETFDILGTSLVY